VTAVLLTAPLWPAQAGNALLVKTKRPSVIGVHTSNEIETSAVREPA
jgi:hypothetical protein